MNKPLFLLWTDGAEAYRKAISAAGLDQRIRLEELPRNATGKIMRRLLTSETPGDL